MFTEAIHALECLLGGVDELAGGRRHREGQARRAAPPLPPGPDSRRPDVTTRALFGKHARDLLADSLGRAGDDADTFFEAELHGRLR